MAYEQTLGRSCFQQSYSFIQTGPRADSNVLFIVRDMYAPPGEVIHA